MRMFRSLPELTDAENRRFVASQVLIVVALTLMIVMTILMIIQSLRGVNVHRVAVAAFAVGAVFMVIGFAADYRYKLRSSERWYAERRREHERAHGERLVKLTELAQAVDRTRRTGDPMSIDTTSRRVLDQLRQLHDDTVRRFEVSDDGSRQQANAPSGVPDRAAGQRGVAGDDDVVDARRRVRDPRVARRNDVD